MLFFVTALLANQIDAQIEAIKNAPVDKRFELMNAFKRKIIRMKEAERIQAIEKLKSVTKSKRTDKVLREIKAKQNAQNAKRSDALTHYKTGKQIERSNIENHIEEQTEEQIQEQIQEQIEEGVENEVENATEDEHEDD